MSDVDPNARPRSRARGCLLAGCLGLLVLAIVPPVLLWSLASEGFEITLGDSPGEWRELERAHPLPGAPAAPAEDALPVIPPPPAPPAVDATPGPGGLPVPPAPPASELPPVPGAAQGRIVLDVSLADLELVPVPAGTPLRLVASYDETRFRLEEDLRQDGAGWTYHLSFRSRGWRPFWNSHGTSSRLRLEVPQGVPISLEGSVGIGASDLELGGLTLAAVQLDLGVGEHRITFSEPTVGRMALLQIDSAMGELTLGEVGNASPREVTIDHGMGELDLDLHGAWRGDSTVELELGMGECAVELPARHEAGGMVVESQMGMGSRDIDDVAEADLPPGLPVVRIHASGGMGHLQVR